MTNENQDIYLPFKGFIKEVKSADPSPYGVLFSINPFLDRYGTYLEHGCPNAAGHMMPKVNEMKNACDKKQLLEQSSAAELDYMLGSMFSMLMPSLVMDENVSSAHSPFVPDFKFSSPAMKELSEDSNWELNLSSIYLGNGSGFNTIKSGAHILNRHYGQNIDLMANTVFFMRNKRNGLERYYKMIGNLNYIDVKVNGEKPALTEKDIHYLLRNMDNADIWLEKLPPEIFSFEGMMISSLVEVTQNEVVYKMKDNASNMKDEGFKASDFVLEIRNGVRSFLNDPDIDFGFIGVTYAELVKSLRLSISQKTNSKLMQEIMSGTSSYYSQAVESKEVVVIEDLLDIKSPSKLEKYLIKNKVRSLIIFPVYTKDGELNSIMEFASPESNKFDALTVLKLRPVFEVLVANSDVFIDEMDNRMNQFIQSQFTSIHPSVVWKFEEVAKKYQIESALDDFTGDLDPIVFKDVFPIYGQADIVGSSVKRNAGIQADLLDNLKRVKNLISDWLGHKDIHVLRSYFNRINKLYNRIENNFITSDESMVVDLLVREVHPFLHQLAKRFEDLPEEDYNAYFAYLDQDLGIVYRERKKYEHSVSKLNQAISDYIEQDDAELQKILPHYFEKYKTDGIEYNMYVGQSIVPNIEFGDYYLKEFKLRQLVQLCEVTKLVDRISPTLDVPLTTAQLIFAYNHTLSIRFRMDEKQFDVDGAYNVRYEILKKRIDKAVIKETKERLTVAGKIAIVYLQDTDRREYLEYIDYLIEQDLIEPEYEVLELEKLQGADGLKAMRLTVKKETALDSQLKELEEGVVHV